MIEWKLVLFRLIGRVRHTAHVVLKRDGKYLLVQEVTPGIRGLWGWPGGGVKAGESPEQAAEREAEEETGFDVELIRKFGEIRDQKRGSVRHIFLGEIKSGRLKINKFEHMNAGWFSEEEIRNLRLRGDWILEVFDQNETPSQIEPTDNIYRLLADWEMKNIRTVDDLILLRDRMFSVLEFRSYDVSTKEEEKQIRWKRTGAQILEDGYVYQGKACTDLVVAYLALAKTGGIKDARFVKVKNYETGAIHSVAELRLENDWYIFDVDNKNALPTKGKIEKDVPWNGFLLWKKGRDAWDLGLTEFDSSIKIKKD